MSSLYSSNILDPLDRRNNSASKNNKFEKGSRLGGSLDLDYLVWTISDRLKAKINKFRNSNPTDAGATLISGTERNALSDPYGIGYEATDRLWQAEADDAARVRFLGYADASGTSRRYRRAATAALLLLIGWVGFVALGDHKSVTALEPINEVNADPAPLPLPLASINPASEERVSDPISAFEATLKDPDPEPVLPVPTNNDVHGDGSRIENKASLRAPMKTVKSIGQMAALTPIEQVSHGVAKPKLSPVVQTTNGSKHSLSATPIVSKPLRRAVEPNLAHAALPSKGNQQAVPLRTAGIVPARDVATPSASPLVPIVRPPADMGAKPNQMAQNSRVNSPTVANDVLQPMTSMPSYASSSSQSSKYGENPAPLVAQLSPPASIPPATNNAAKSLSPPGQKGPQLVAPGLVEMPESSTCYAQGNKIRCNFESATNSVN